MVGAEKRTKYKQKKSHVKVKVCRPLCWKNAKI